MKNSTKIWIGILTGFSIVGILNTMSFATHEKIFGFFLSITMLVFSMVWSSYEIHKDLKTKRRKKK